MRVTAARVSVSAVRCLPRCASDGLGRVGAAERRAELAGSVSAHPPLPETIGNLSFPFPKPDFTAGLRPSNRDKLVPISSTGLTLSPSTYRCLCCFATEAFPPLFLPSETVFLYFSVSFTLFPIRNLV